MGLKGWLGDNLNYNEAHADDHGAALGAVTRTGIGFGKGMLQLAGYGAHLLATVGDQPSNQDVIAYQKANPGASTDDAMRAVSGKDKDGNPVQAYRSPENQHVQQHLQESADWFKQNAKTQGFWEGLGSTGEQLVELLGTDGLSEMSALRDAQAAGDTAKALTMSDKLKQIQGVASFMEKNPRIAKMVGLGIRTAHAAARAGGQAAAQTYVHTQGDGTQAAIAGATGGVLGGGISAAAGAASQLIQHLAPQISEIAGEEVPILRSQVTGVGEDGLPQRPSWIQKAAADTNDSQSVVDQQQRAAFGTVREQAQGVVDRELGAANETRTPTADRPSTVDPVTGKPVEEHVWPKAGAPAEDAGAAGLPSGAPQLTSGTPELGTGESADLARTDMLGQPGEAPTAEQKGLPGSEASSGPNVEDTSAKALPSGEPAKPAPRFQLQPIDVKGAIARTNDFGDAADVLHENAKPVYDRLNEVTKGQWQAADAKIRGLQDKSWKAVGPEREAMESQLTHARGVMDRIMSDPKTGISPADLSAAKRLWSTGYKLRTLHNALEPAYQVDADFARRGTEYRGFNGGRALSRFRTALAREPELKNILGNEGTDNLQRVFRYNTTVKGRQAFGEGVGKIARFMSERVPGVALAGIGYHLGGLPGAAELGTAGESAYLMTKTVLHKVATDPQVGRSLLYALDHARADSYVPTIGNMILRKTLMGVRGAVPLVADSVAQN